MAEPSPALAKTLTVPRATALALSIVIGSGLLVLPGLAYQQAGSAALHAWVIDAAIVVPLLVIFAYLGSRHPTAGGIAGFVQAAFCRRGGAMTEILLMGTFGLGIPAIAITGGNYVAAAGGTGTAGAAAGTFGLLALAASVNYRGAELSGRTQQVLAFVLVVVLAGAAVVALTFGDTSAGAGVASVTAWPAAIGSLGLVFFAFTGWEMLSFTAEEYRRPRRDFPLTVALSFVAVIGLYLAIALAIQLTVSPADPRLASAPVAAMLGSSLGPTGAAAVAVVSVLIIAANLIGACWAASRLVYASAREGLLPERLAAVHAGSRTPRAAVLAVTGAFAAVIGLHFTGVAPLAVLLQVAGQNFFILYGLTVVAYVRLVSTPWARALGVVSLAVVVLVMGTFGWWLLYPLALCAAGLGVVSLRGSSPPPSPAFVGGRRV